jgi:hypothetical protein
MNPSNFSIARFYGNSFAFCVSHLSLVIADQGVAILSKIGHTKQYNQNGISGSS